MEKRQLRNKLVLAGIKTDTDQAEEIFLDALHAVEAVFLERVAGYKLVTGAYKIEPLTKEEYETLSWLSDRGYDGGILELTSGGETEDGGYAFEPIPENVAWQINDNIAEDEHAFLSSNGSRSLADKLFDFLEKIV